MTLAAIKPYAWSLALPAVAAIDWRWSLAMALGMLGGWLARTGQSVEARRPWPEIRRDWIVSASMSIGSILATLYFARLTAADELGVASIAFAIAWGGSDSLRMFPRFILAPIVAAIRKEEPRP